MMCQTIGRPPISTSGLGLISVSSDRRVPAPPHRITTGTRPSGMGQVLRVPRHGSPQALVEREGWRPAEHGARARGIEVLIAYLVRCVVANVRLQDRKSTRLNSSHMSISYAV